MTCYEPHRGMFHWKTMIVDNAHIWTGSCNLTYTAMNCSEEMAVVIECPDLATRCGNRFDEIWTSEHAHELKQASGA